MKIHNFRRSSGFTIVEMMIALALGLVISAAVLSVFISSKRSFNDNTRIARLQDKGRSALYLIANDLRHANFWGPLIEVGSLDTFPGGALSGPCSAWAASAIVENRFVGSAAPKTNAVFTTSCLTSADIQDNTSAVALKRVDNSPIAFTDSEFQSGEIFLRANSLVGELLVKGTDSGASAPAAGLSDWIYQPQVYFVRTYWETNGDNLPSLCVVNIDPDVPTAMRSSPQCLISGIEYLHIDYGFDRTGDGVPDEYMESPTAAQMNEVSAIQLYVLVRDDEPDPFYSNQRTYQLGVQTVTVNDQYRRALFSTTIIPQNQRTLPIKVRES
jgi:type IV pilus assembly protein PilW